MASDEYNIETLVIAILADSATFSGVSIVHHVEDDSTVSKGDRLTVKCDPAFPLVDARKMSLPAGVLQANVTITAQSSAAETTFDGWRDAIDAAINAASYPASVVTTATGLFPNGVILDQISGGTLFDQEKRRELTRTFRVVFRT